MLRHAAATLIVFSFGLTLSAGDSQKLKETSASNEGPVIRPSPPGAEKDLALYHIRGMVEDISSFQSRGLRADGLSQIADLVWSQDEEYARDLFNKAMALASVEGEDKDARVLLRLRQNILARIARHDALWAKRLVERAAGEGDEKRSAAEKRELNIRVAKSLQEEDPKLATEFASNSLRDGVSTEFIEFLKSLRQRDRASADRLFLQALNQFAQQPSGDANAFAMFGTYVFTSRRLDGSDPSSVLITRVGDIGMVDITADRPGVAPTLVRSYLQAAAAVLNRQMTDPYQQEVGYALSYLLLPKAQQFAPDLVPPIGAALARLSANVPPSMTQASAYTNITKAAVDGPEQAMSNAEKLPDAESRDVAYLDLAFRSWLKNDFATAQTAGGRIDDKDVRSQLETLIDFGRASAKLKKSGPQLFEAAQIANRLPQGIERAVLYLGISEMASKEKNAPLAIESNAQARAALGSVPDSRKPYLSLLAAAQLARYNAAEAAPAFADAVKEFNALDGPASADVRWAEKVEVGALAEHFPLNISGLDFSVGKSFRSIMSVGSFDNAVLTARGFKNERLRLSAFVALTDEVLQALPKEEQSGERVVRVGEDGMRKSAAKTVMPVYPEGAAEKGEQGVVVVEAQYNGKGDVTDTAVLEAPSAGLGQAVVAAVKQWKFTPSSLNGEPISVRGKLTFYFLIDKDKKGRVENPKQFR
jgi:TonB family protein